MKYCFIFEFSTLYMSMNRNTSQPNQRESQLVADGSFDHQHTVRPKRCLPNAALSSDQRLTFKSGSFLRTFAPKSSYGEIFFISPLELVHKVLTPKMKKKMGVTDFVSEKMAVEKCLNFDKSVTLTRCSLLC